MLRTLMRVEPGELQVVAREVAHVHEVEQIDHGVRDVHVAVAKVDRRGLRDVCRERAVEEPQLGVHAPVVARDARAHVPEIRQPESAAHLPHRPGRLQRERERRVEQLVALLRRRGGVVPGRRQRLHALRLQLACLHEMRQGAERRVGAEPRVQLGVTLGRRLRGLQGGERRRAAGQHQREQQGNAGHGRPPCEGRDRRHVTNGNFL